MLPVKSVRQQLGALLSADATTLAPAVNANEIALVVAPFTPNENLVIANLTLASGTTFTGGGAINVPLGAQGVGNDPVTGDQIVTILAPAGGWRWVCTAAPAGPVTVYGFCLATKTAAALLASQLLPTPIVIQNVNDQIDLGDIQIVFVIQPMS